MRVLAAHSHYFHVAAEGQGLPSLDAMLAPLCREKFRRVDRFIQLALLGSAQCAAGRSLSPTCPLYLASGAGPVGNNVTVQEQLCRDKKLPKPFNFINTLGSSSGYYVAKNLGLSGQNLFISRQGSSLAAALECAWADMDLGVCDEALVGVVEECVLPLAQQRQRLGQPPGQALAEGSHWLYLRNDGPGRSIDLKRTQASAADGRHSLGAYHASLDAAWATHSLALGTAGPLQITIGDEASGFWALDLSA